MNKIERIKAALAKEEVDRVPCNLWMHFSEADQDPRTLAETQVAFAKKYDFDFIKLMPFGLYGVQDYGTKIQIFNRPNRPPVVADHAIHSSADWDSIEPLPAHYGTLGKQVQLAQHVGRLAGGEIPFIQTVFSPLTNARKMAGDRILVDMKENPEAFKRALRAIAETTVNFVKANIDAGVHGFFFATQCATTDFLTEAEYREFGVPYDLQVIEAFRNETYFNVAHIHGTNTMFDLVERYPVPCLNWHDRWSGLTLGEARKLTDKCLLGGIREIPWHNDAGDKIRESILVSGSVSDVERHVAEAIEDAGRLGLIIGPGCVADQLSVETNIHAIRRTVSGKLLARIA